MTNQTEKPLGIPYARGEIIKGKLYRVCPECGEKIQEPTDSVGEATANPYGEHYVENHS